MQTLKQVLLCSFLLSACNSEAFEKPEAKTDKTAAAKTQDTPQTFTQRFFQPDAQLNAQVDAVYNALSPKERAAQMIMAASSTAVKLGYPYDKAKEMITGDIAANLVFLKGTTADFKSQVKELDQLGSRQ